LSSGTWSMRSSSACWRRSEGVCNALARSCNSRASWMARSIKVGSKRELIALECFGRRRLESALHRSGACGEFRDVEFALRVDFALEMRIEDRFDFRFRRQPCADFQRKGDGIERFDFHAESIWISGAPSDVVLLHLSIFLRIQIASAREDFLL